MMMMMMVVMMMMMMMVIMMMMIMMIMMILALMLVRVVIPVLKLVETKHRVEAARRQLIIKPYGIQDQRKAFIAQFIMIE